MTFWSSAGIRNRGPRSGGWLPGPGQHVASRSLSLQLPPWDVSQHLRFVLPSDCKAVSCSVTKYDGAKQRAREQPLSSGISLDLGGYLYSAPLLPLKVFQ